MENKDYKYQDIKELADNFNSIQIELNNKIEDYVLDVLRKIENNYIMFDNEQQETTRYFVDGNITTLTSLEIAGIEHEYVELTFLDEFKNWTNGTLSDMTVDQQISIVEDIKTHIQKHGYKN